MKLIDKSALVAEIEKRKSQFMSQADNFHSLGMEEKRDHFAILASNMHSILSFIDTLEVKEVQEEPVSEFLNTESMIESYKQRLISQANGMKNSPLIDMCLASYKHGINEALDTLNLSNVQRTTKNWKEPVSEELEEAVNAYIGYAPEVDESSSTYGKRQAFKAGANWQKEYMEKEYSDLNKGLVSAKGVAVYMAYETGRKDIIGKVRSILNKVAYKNNSLDVNGDYCEQPYVELDNEFRKLYEE